MPPLACVSFPELPLQLVIRARPEWRELPVAVLTEDRPTGIVLHRNRAAVRAGVYRGMRYSAALALSHVLRAAVLEPEELHEGIETICHLLSGFSPHVEPCAFADGIFWLDAQGLGYLFPSIAAWMQAIIGGMESAGFRARVASGFSRGGTLVASRASPKEGSSIGFASPEEERAFCLPSPLTRLPLDAGTRRRLAALGIRDVKGFLSLPAGGLRMRLGPEAARLHEILDPHLPVPLQPLEKVEPLLLRHLFDREVRERAEIEPPLEEALRAITEDAGRRGTRLRDLLVAFSMEDGSTREERIRPSEPTAALKLLWELLCLRLSAVFPPGNEAARRCAVVGFSMSAEQSRKPVEQIELIPYQSRDRGAGARAFALIRAEIGNDAVCRACIRAEHLPERQYSWEPIGEPPLVARSPGPPPVEVQPLVAAGADRPWPPSTPLVAASVARRESGRDAVRREQGGGRQTGPRPREAQIRPRLLVRRICESPLPLPPRPPGGRAHRCCGGPYALSGGWWSRPTCREYRFVEAVDGTILWIYRERESRWMIQGLLR